MTDPSRRQFLGAAAALTALPAPETDREAGEDDTGADAATATDDAQANPLGDLHSSLHAEGSFDEAIELDPCAGEMWTGQEWVPVVDLYIRFWMGDLCVTLDEEAARALADQLQAPFEESS